MGPWELSWGVELWVTITKGCKGTISARSAEKIFHDFDAFLKRSKWQFGTKRRDFFAILMRF